MVDVETPSTASGVKMKHPHTEDNLTILPFCLPPMFTSFFYEVYNHFFVPCSVIISCCNFWNLWNHFLCNLYFKSLQGRFVAVYNFFFPCMKCFKKQDVVTKCSFYWMTVHINLIFIFLKANVSSHSLRNLWWNTWNTCCAFYESCDNIPKTETKLCLNTPMKYHIPHSQQDLFVGHK